MMRSMPIRIRVRAHDWESDSPRILGERIELVNALLDLPLAIVADIVKALSPEHAVICCDLMDKFVLAKIKLGDK